MFDLFFNVKAQKWPLQLKVKLKACLSFLTPAAGGDLCIRGVIVKTECGTLTFSSSGSFITAGKTGRLTLSPSCYELHIPADVKGILGNSNRGRRGGMKKSLS